MTLNDSSIREPDQIRQDAARKLREVEISDHFRAILGCLLGENWTTPRLIEMSITPDGHMVGRCEGEVEATGTRHFDTAGMAACKLFWTSTCIFSKRNAKRLTLPLCA